MQSSEYVPKAQPTKKWQAHHLYVCFSDSLALKNHLRFRDALLATPQLVEKYADLKMALVKEVGMTRTLYSKRKTDFIIEVLRTQGLAEEELIEIINANL